MLSSAAVAWAMASPTLPLGGPHSGRRKVGARVLRDQITFVVFKLWKCPWLSRRKRVRCGQCSSELDSIHGIGISLGRCGRWKSRGQTAPVGETEVASQDSRGCGQQLGALSTSGAQQHEDSVVHLLVTERAPALWGYQCGEVTGTAAGRAGMVGKRVDWPCRAWSGGCSENPGEAVVVGRAPRRGEHADVPGWESQCCPVAREVGCCDA